MTSSVVDRPRVLVIDDDPHVLRATARMLERIGFAPVAFSSPLRALQRVVDGDRDFLAVVTDFHMSEMHGPELATSLTSAGLSCPYLLISGTPPAEPTLPLLEKPFTPTQLAFALGRLGVASRKK